MTETKEDMSTRRGIESAMVNRAQELAKKILRDTKGMNADAVAGYFCTIGEGVVLLTSALYKAYADGTNDTVASVLT